MKPICQVTNDNGAWGYIAITHQAGQDCPRIGWFNNAGEYCGRAGGGFLRREVDRGIPDREEWLEKVEQWLKDSQNDCLRARGDIRWQVMSRAQVILKGEL